MQLITPKHWMKGNSNNHRFATSGCWTHDGNLGAVHFHAHTNTQTHAWHAHRRAPRAERGAADCWEWPQPLQHSNWTGFPPTFCKSTPPYSLVSKETEELKLIGPDAVNHRRGRADRRCSPCTCSSPPQRGPGPGRGTGWRRSAWGCGCRSDPSPCPSGPGLPGCRCGSISAREGGGVTSSFDLMMFLLILIEEKRHQDWSFALQSGTLLYRYNRIPVNGDRSPACWVHMEYICTFADNVIIVITFNVWILRFKAAATGSLSLSQAGWCDVATPSVPLKRDSLLRGRAPPASLPHCLKIETRPSGYIKHSSRAAQLETRHSGPRRLGPQRCSVVMTSYTFSLRLKLKRILVVPSQSKGLLRY